MNEEFETLTAERASDDPALIVDVEGFEGPLDLLLVLARQQKVDLAGFSPAAPPPQRRRRAAPPPAGPPPAQSLPRGAEEPRRAPAAQPRRFRPRRPGADHR